VSITQEALHSIKKKNIPSFILKLDLSKAYDRDNWTFIRLVLIQLGMNLESINWIMGCLESSSFVVLINGFPPLFLYPQEALGKGSLFPLVVLSVAEGLSLLIKKARSEGHLKGVRITNLKIISHLLFVDDVILFGAEPARRFKL
jgi:hypothetical protein